MIKNTEVKKLTKKPLIIAGMLLSLAIIGVGGCGSKEATETQPSTSTPNTSEKQPSTSTPDTSGKQPSTSTPEATEKQP